MTTREILYSIAFFTLSLFAAACFALGLCGCGGGRPRVLTLTVDATGRVARVEALRVSLVAGEERSLPLDVPIAGGPADVPPARTLSLEVPRPGPVRVDVEALRGGVAVARGSAATEGDEARVVLGGEDPAPDLADLPRDLGREDLSSDLKGPDLEQPDLQPDMQPDLVQPEPDLARSEKPDLAQSDLAQHDLVPLPDLAPPDLARPDLAQPDLARPDLTELPPSAPSCAGIPRTCGSSGREDCCASTIVTGGTHRRSYDGVDYADGDNPATVSHFRLDRYEVTVGRFRRFADAVKVGWRPPAGAGAHPKVPGSGWDPSWPLAGDLRPGLKCALNQETWTDAPGGNEDKPLNCASWYDAHAFCAWDGGRLPTEAEWDRAAAGGDEQRVWPWSSPPWAGGISDQLAVYCGNTCAPQPVGSRSPGGDGRWSHADLSGNVWEWVLDAYGPYPNPCVDCARTSGASRALRGGNWSSGPLLRPQVRGGVTPLNRDNSSGFRCARAP